MQRHGLALLGYLALAIALTWPLATNPGGMVIGGWESRDFSFEDASQNIWNIWWVGHAIAQGQNPFWSDLLYYPEGVQLYIQTLNLAGVLPVLPIHYAFGPVAAYNCALLLAMALTGYAGFLLARAFVPGLVVPLLVGALLTASPFHLMKLQGNHLNLVSMQWMVLYVLALVWLERRRDAPTALAAAVMALLVVLTDWYWVLACALFSLVLMALNLLRRGERRRLLRAYGLFTAFTLALSAPLLLAIWSIRDRLDLRPVAGNAWWRLENQIFSSDALGLFFPAFWRFLAPEQREALFRQLTPELVYFQPEAWYVAAGWVLLALAAVGVWSAGRAHWPLLAASACMWLCSLGPVLTLAGVRFELALPYALLQELPLFSTARRSSHLAALCLIVAVIFAALGLHRLTRALPRPWRGALLGAVALLAVIELWPAPWQQYQFQVAPFFSTLAAAPGVVADLPYEENWTSRALCNQTVHGQPILGGYVARRPAYMSLQMVPLFNQIATQRPWPDDITPYDPATLRAMQCYYRLRYVTVALAEMDERQLRNLTRIMGTLTGGPLTPIYHDQAYLAYELPLFAAACRPFLYLDQGWYELEQDAMRSWRWSSASNQIWLVNPHATPVTTLLHLAAEGQRPVQAELWSDNTMLARWELAANPREYTLALMLPPGAKRLTLKTATSSEPGTVRQIGIALTSLWLETPALPQNGP